MMAAPDYLHLNPILSFLCFWGGILGTVIFVFLAILTAMREENRESKIGSSRRMFSLIGMAICGIGFVAFAAWHFWPTQGKDNVASLSEQSPQNHAPPLNYGVLAPKGDQDSVVLFSPGHTTDTLFEIGDSGSVFKWTGPQGAPLMQFTEKMDLVVESIGGHVKVSTKIFNSNGSLVAELYRNEWKVAPPPSTWDRNYSDNALEVRDSSGEVVLQVAAVNDRIRLQAIWWIGKDSAIELASTGKGKGAALITRPPNSNQKLISIQKIFAYPSELHLGEIVHDEILN